MTRHIQLNRLAACLRVQLKWGKHTEAERAILRGMLAECYRQIAQ